MVPHHDDESLRNLAYALDDEAHYVDEVLLANSDLSWIKVSTLEPGKEQFRRSHVVAVGSQVHQRDVQGLEQAPRLD